MPLIIATNDQSNPQPVGASNPLPVGVRSTTMPSTLLVGVKTVAANTTPEPLVAASVVSVGMVTITALSSNTNNVFVGDSTLTGTGSNKGTALAAGVAIQVLIDDLSKVYVGAAVNGEGVSYFGS